MTNHSTIVLFADLADSVQLYESLGDAAAKAIVVDLQKQLENVVTEYSGVVHEVIGDEIMCRFELAEQAVLCAANVHQCTLEFQSNTTVPLPDTLQMRVGIHLGSAIYENGRLFGDVVNTAARTMSVALAGQTITTHAVVEQLPSHIKKLARQFDKITFKGKSEPMVIYDLPWQTQDITKIKEVTLERKPTALWLSYDDKQHPILNSDCPVIIGRAANNLIVVDSDPVSRRHISIEYQRGRFVLSDKSTNGTYIHPDSGEPIYIRREQMPLWGSGRLFLGAPEYEATNHIVNYRCKKPELTGFTDKPA